MTELTHLEVLAVVSCVTEGIKKVGFQHLIREHQISTESAHPAIGDTRSFFELMLFQDQQTGRPYFSR